MQAGDGFELVTQNENALDEYTMFPAAWHAILPVEKKAAVQIVKTFDNNAWGIECCRELMAALKVNVSDITSLQPDIFLAIDNPTHVDRGILYEKPELSEEQAEDARIVEVVESNRAKANSGMSMMERRPPGLKGIELFEKMLNFSQRAFGKKADKHNISDYLEINTRTPHQHALMEIDYHLKIQGILMDDLNEVFSLQRAVQVPLDNLGQIKIRSTFINDPTRLERLRAIYELRRSLGGRDEIESLDDEESMKQEKSKLATKLPDAVKMFANNETGKLQYTMYL